MHNHTTTHKHKQAQQQAAAAVATLARALHPHPSSNGIAAYTAPAARSPSVGQLSAAALEFSPVSMAAAASGAPTAAEAVSAAAAAAAEPQVGLPECVPSSGDSAMDAAIARALSSSPSTGSGRGCVGDDAEVLQLLAQLSGDVDVMQVRVCACVCACACACACACVCVCVCVCVRHHGCENELEGSHVVMSHCLMQFLGRKSRSKCNRRTRRAGQNTTYECMDACTGIRCLLGNFSREITMIHSRTVYVNGSDHSYEYTLSSRATMHKVGIAGALFISNMVALFSLSL